MADYNPFNPNSVVTPSLFAGRVEQVKEICQKLTQVKHGMPANFLIFGERGIGKTALAKLVGYISRVNDKGFYSLNLLTSYYITEQGQSISSVLQESVNKLTDQMDKTLVQDMVGRLGKLFNNGKFQIGAFGSSVGVDLSSKATKSALDITIKDQTVSILSNIIKSLNKKVDTSDDTQKDTQDGVLIIIDELHNLEDIPSAASILRNIITTLDVDGLGKIAFLLIGYEEDMKRFFSVDSSSRRTFDIKELGVMPIKDAKEVLTKGFIEVSVKWDEDALNRNIQVAGGYPHSIQILGHNLIETDKDGLIDQNDWTQVIFDTALDLQDKEFSTMYTFKKKQNEKDKILATLAGADNPLTKTELKKLNLSKNVYRCLQELKAAGAIKEDDEEKIHLHSQLFRTAIRFDVAYRRLVLKQTTDQAQV